MGAEQSSSGGAAGPSGSNGAPTGVSASFSFLAQRSSSKKPTTTVAAPKDGVVMVNAHKVQSTDPKDDEDFRRLTEMPRFLPILRHAIGKKDTPSDVAHRVSHKPILRLAIRFQDHLAATAVEVAKEQNSLTSNIKKMEAESAVVVSRLVSRKKSQEKISEQLKKLSDDIQRVTILFEEIVPCVETLNELLPVELRLPPLNLGRVLERRRPRPQEQPRRTDLVSSLPLVEEIRVVDHSNA